MITVLVLEGADATGKTRHADLLAQALGARVFHHQRPAGDDPVAHALDYAAQRRRLITEATDGAVIVADRWITSTDILRMALPPGVLRRALGNIVEAERELLRGDEAARGYRKHQIFLTSPAAVLDARLRERGSEPTDAERAMRELYSDRADWRASVDTSRVADAVAAELLAWARGVLS